MRINALAITCLVALSAPLAHADVEIPVAPANVMTKGVPRPIDAKPKQSSTEFAGLAKVNENSILVMEPGVNQIVPIAITHLNRLVTPFATPAVQTSAGESAQINIKDNVVYAATGNEAPVTLFITEKGDQGRALSLTLVPQQIPPRELFLRLPEALGYMAGAANAKAESWEKSQPYVETVRAVFRKIALGEVPQGYTMTRMPGNMPRPSCQQPGLSFDFANGQLVMGHSLSVLVGVATNTSSQPIEFKEAVCGAWDVAAVAAWPLNVLEPGKRTEIYVARKIGKKQGPTSKRPSLVGAY